MLVGTVVGKSVGEFVGKKEGCLRVGATLGRDGADVGLVVTGCIDGCCVGAVGERVGVLVLGVTVGLEGADVGFAG